MKVEVRFADDKGYIAKVGMNNLIIIEDDRITTQDGIRNRVQNIVTKYRPAYRGREYRVYHWLTDDVIFLDKAL